MTASGRRDPGSITDVPGVRVGHTQRTGRGWRTGTTVVLTSDGAVGGVDVRGGGPGTRETDLLRPENLVQQIHAICLTGGSAFGLAAADGVMQWLEERGVGFPVGDQPHAVVPIVPTAVIFDLGRGGRFGARPDASFGRRAVASSRRSGVARGAVGAGTGAIAGGLQGGVGMASTTLADGSVVGALAVVNAVGQVIDPSTGLPWEARHMRRPGRDERRALDAFLAESRFPPLNTTIGVVATSARLSKAECSKMAATSHDGLARAIRPAHSMNDGDTIFAISTGHDDLVLGAGDDPFRSPRSRAARLNALLEAAARVFADACTDAVISAEGVGGPLAYRDLCPSAIDAL
jgi:L-aminopeptidase/D-esterase-like protein